MENNFFVIRTKLKLLAVFCAIIIWIYANLDKNTVVVRQTDVKINFVNIPDGIIPVNYTENVKVRLKGSRLDVLKVIKNKNIIAKIDLTTFSKGYHKNIPLSVSVISNKVSLIDYKPESLDFELIVSHK